MIQATRNIVNFRQMYDTFSRELTETSKCYQTRQQNNEVVAFPYNPAAVYEYESPKEITYGEDEVGSNQGVGFVGVP